MRIHGTLIHTPDRGTVEILEGALLEVGEDGGIGRIDCPADPQRLEEMRKRNDFIELGPDQYLLPGLVDLHVHAPQWPQLGKALHLPLDEWLQRYTFPLEARYEDLEFARASYESLVDALLANGTTTAMYFGTVHLEATKLLADIALARGQRAVVGKVAMDCVEQCPDYYRDRTTQAGLDDTRALIEYINGLPGDLVMPAVTPRFIPSCTDPMLDGLAKIADEYRCHVQTHCSESDWEHDFVLGRHGMTDTQSLDRIGLLTERTILAHANRVDDVDLATIQRRMTGIAHCPLSNLYLSHSVFPARKALDRGLRVGLGTDIAGGPSASILANCQLAIAASRALEDGVDPSLPPERRGVPGSRINYREAFWMATAGGAEALGIKAGLFRPGYDFDAIVIDAAQTDSDLKVWKELDGGDDVLQKIIYNANRRNVSRVWVRGRQVRG